MNCVNGPLTPTGACRSRGRLLPGWLLTSGLKPVRVTVKTCLTEWLTAPEDGQQPGHGEWLAEGEGVKVRSYLHSGQEAARCR